MKILLYLLNFIYILYIQCLTVPPTWVTSNLVRAGNRNIISTRTGNQSFPTFTFLFSSALSGVPNLGYGIKAYEGNDYLGEEMFEVNRTALDATSFSVAVKILETTNILKMNVPYIAIDPGFPHHLNSFDNVPVNYSKGSLTNITAFSNVTQTYFNRINYTQQALGRTYNTFLKPFSRNKVLLFMTSLFFRGKNEENSTILNPINFRVQTNVVATNFYRILVTLSIQVRITRLHFSMVIFDETDVQSSGTYTLIYQRVQFTYQGGFIPIPIQFIDNFIMGWLDFTTNKTQSIVDFQWQFANVSGVHGVYMPLSVAQTNFVWGTNTILTIGYTLFYIKTWICPSTPEMFLDLSTNLCTTCPIPYCLDCLNLTACSICDEANDYFLNLTNLLCQPCFIEGCIDCRNFNVCLACNVTADYVMANGTCDYCNNSENIFVNSANQCQLCTIPNCLECFNLTYCMTCNYTDSYYLSAPLHSSTCLYCNASNNMFINPLKQCQACSIPYCIECLSLTQCVLCDIDNGYYQQSSPSSSCSYCDASINMFINFFTYQCQECVIDNCVRCSELGSCIQCNSSNGYYLPSIPSSYCQYCNETQNMFINSTSFDCQLCQIQGCLVCGQLDLCLECNITDGYYLINGQCLDCLALANCSSNDTNSSSNASNTSNSSNSSSNGTYSNQTNSTTNETNSTTNQTSNNSTNDTDIRNTTNQSNSSNTTTDNSTDNITNNTGNSTENSTNNTINQTANSTTNQTTNSTTNNSSNITNQTNNTNNSLALANCGNGLLENAQDCDDGNLINLDGCSSICQTEILYTCNNSINSNIRVCFANFFIEPNSFSMNKLSCNRFNIKFTSVNQSITFQTMRFTHNSIKIKTITKTVNTIEIQAFYTQDIVNQTLQLYEPTSAISLRFVYSSVIPLLYFDQNQNQCQFQQQKSETVLAFQISAYAVLFLSIFSAKIVGLQLFGVLQLAYFSMAFLDFYDVYLQIFKDFKIFNGYNLQFFSQDSLFLPENISILGISSSFINNCNIMMLLLYAQIFLAISLYLISKIARKKNIQKVSLRLMKEGFITFVMFNIFNITFSAGIHWKYSDQFAELFIFSSVILYLTLIFCISAVFAIELVQEKQYGQFKQKFKDTLFCRSYIAISIVYRMMLGLYISIQSQYMEATLLILAVSIAFVMYNLINLPFRQAYQNYRCNIIHFTQLTTLIVMNYYRSMKANTDIQIKARIHWPALLVISMIIVSIFVSFVSLVVQIYRRLWKKDKKQKIIDISARKNNTDYSLDMFTLQQ